MIWIIGVGIVLFYLYYLLTIEFKLAKLDDDVAQPETDVHNDLSIWSYEFYLPRVKARKLRAFLRWVGVSAVTMLFCFLFAGGGQRVKALVLPAPTPSITPTFTASPTPTATQTPTALETFTLTPTGTSTENPTPTQGQLYKPGPVQVVVQTRVVQVTRIVVKVVTALPGPTQTPWIIYITAGPTLTGSPTPTLLPTSSPTPTLTPSETASPTLTETPSPSPTPTETETQQVTP